MRFALFGALLSSLLLLALEVGLLDARAEVLVAVAVRAGLVLEVSVLVL
jgi:hypothetical protein